MPRDLLAASPVPLTLPRPQKQRVASGGTPEQIHLTWGRDPATSLAVSWASPEASVRPRLLLAGPGGRSAVASAVRRNYTDGLSGEVIWTYHAQLTGLEPDTVYSYVVTADNDASDGPFSATFRTAPRGRAAFRFTSFGDLATPSPDWALSYGQSAYAVAAVESFRPLFHLLNGDLCYADLNPGHQPEVWRDFGNNCQASAAHRAWMPCPGNHEVEFNNGPQGLGSYLTRYSLPDNGVPGFRGHWYSFRVGSALFVSLDANDVVHQDAGPLVTGPEPLEPAAGAGHPEIPLGTSFYIRGYSRGAQTAWLGRTLAAARGDRTIDWIIVQMHQDAASSSATGNGSDLGIRQAWLPLFDRYQVDLVLCGHDHDYERSFPVRGFDSSQAKVFTRPNRPAATTVPGVFARPGADALEDATWSAMRDASSGYGIAVFDVHPGEVRGGMTSITVRYFHAVGADPVNPASGRAGAPTPSYTEFETFTLVRHRSDR